VYIEKRDSDDDKGEKIENDGDKGIMKPYMTLENIEAQNDLAIEANIKEVREWTLMLC
jgi:hypothetical protein